MKEMVEWLNSSQDAWEFFLLHPEVVLEKYSISLTLEYRAVLINDVYNLFQPVRYIPGWPISRLPKDVQQNTYEILMKQQEIFEAGIKSQEDRTS